MLTPEVLCRISQTTERKGRQRSVQANSLRGTVGGSSPRPCPPCELIVMRPVFPSGYQRRLKSAANDLPVSCLIFVMDF